MNDHRKIVSHHLFRRTARNRLRQLKVWQKIARAGDGNAAQRSAAIDRLREKEVAAYDTLTVEPSIRGPFGWYVVAR